MHGGQLGTGGHRLGDDDRLDRIALLLSVSQCVLPVAIGSDRCGQAGPAIATIGTGSGDLGFQAAVGNAQLDG
ncbi:hypothetical protein D3C86_2126740 [compost metagenome]